MTTIPKKLCQKAKKFFLSPKVTEKSNFFKRKQVSWKCSSGHVKCNIENYVENISTKRQIVSPKIRHWYKIVNLFNFFLLRLYLWSRREHFWQPCPKFFERCLKLFQSVAQTRGQNLFFSEKKNHPQNVLQEK